MVEVWNRCYQRERITSNLDYLVQSEREGAAINSLGSVRGGCEYLLLEILVHLVLKDVKATAWYY